MSELEVVVVVMMGMVVGMTITLWICDDFGAGRRFAGHPERQHPLLAGELPLECG